MYIYTYTHTRINNICYSWGNCWYSCCIAASSAILPLAPRAEEGGHLCSGDCRWRLQDSLHQGANQQVLWQRAEHDAERRRGRGQRLCAAGGAPSPALRAAARDPWLCCVPLDLVQTLSFCPQCAILSPAFKVREFSITDVVPYSVSLKWNSAAEDGLRWDPRTLSLGREIDSSWHYSVFLKVCHLRPCRK